MWPFRKRTPAPEPEWTDPLDPHGDGTLRPGDPIYDAAMSGKTVFGNFGPEGWVLEEKDED